MEKKLNELKPHFLNKEIFEDTNTEQYESLKDDINERGLQQAIDIDENNVILGGHRRFKIAKELKWDFIKCNVHSGMTDLEKQDWVIKDNSHRRQLTEYQRIKCYERIKSIENEKAKIRQIEAGNKGGQEFKGKQKIENTKGLPETSFKPPQGTLAREKAATRVSEATGIKSTGQTLDTKVKKLKEIKEYKPELINKIKDESIKINEAHRIVEKEIKKKEEKQEREELSKSTKLSKDFSVFNGDCLKELSNVPDNSVDLLLTDPPYGIDYKSNRREYETIETQKIAFDDKQAFELLDKTLSICDKKLKKDSHLYIFTSWKVIEKVKPIVSKYFNVKTCIAWVKNHTAGDLSSFSEGWEVIIFATKGNKKIFCETRPKNVMSYNVKERFHPTEKPLELLTKLINFSTKPGDVVLDPFAGCGSTLVASKRSLRNFYGVELNKDFFNVIVDRLKDE